MSDKDDNIFYVYIHRRLSDNKLFYVGKGKNKRHSSGCSRNDHWKNIASKHGWYSKILKKNLSEKEAYDLEEIIINRVGVDNLSNRNFYNKGQSGYKHSEKSKNKMSESKKGRTPWNKGLKMPEMSESRKGINNPRYGAKTVHTENTKRKLRLKFGILVCDLSTGIFYESVEEACCLLQTSRRRIFKKVTIV
jgi:hypothetical protein